MTKIQDNMTANKVIPHISVHPGEILKDEIEYRRISQRQLAKEIGMSYSVLNEILNCKRPVTTEFALMIEAALSIDHEPLLKMQSNYDVQMAKRDNSFLKKLEKIRKVAAIL